MFQYQQQAKREDVEDLLAYPMDVKIEVVDL